MKKGDLSINYIFLIFIATLATFVIIALITKWSGSAGGFVDNLFGKDEDAITDIQLVDLDDCSVVQNEVIKHAKLCYTKSKQGLVKGNLCYGILNPGNCGISSNAISTNLNSNNMDNQVSNNLDSTKIIISYDYGQQIVEVY